MQGVRDAWLRDCSFQGPPGRGLSRFSGGYGEGETPLPIPNRAVKPLSADGTWLARARESRTPPVESVTSRPTGRLVRVKRRVAPCDGAGVPPGVSRAVVGRGPAK